MSPFDTIVAPITGSQAAAVAILRLSGPDAWEIARRVCRNWPKAPESHRAVYGSYVTGDDGLTLPFAEDSSYTGEEAVELSLHGSPASVSALVEACIQAGARSAEPGEFTQRGFLNGRMDLTQAEAVADTVNALTATQLRLANRQRQGALRDRVSDIYSAVASLLGAVEASVDFEEEIGPVDRPSALSKLASQVEQIDALLKTAEVGRIMRRGMHVAIVGPPNAGKSSLFNALVGRERAIVTHVPGTTRDYIEESLDMGGVPVVLTDTAGIREAADLAESMGIEKSLTQAAEADLVWYVYDAAEGLPPQNIDLGDSPVWYIANKADLSPAPVKGHYSVSALTGMGLDRLIEEVGAIAKSAEALAVPPINERHQPLLLLARQSITDAEETIRSNRPDDLLSTHLRTALQSLGEVTGESAEANLIDRIFADFCIGK